MILFFWGGGGKGLGGGGGYAMSYFNEHKTKFAVFPDPNSVSRGFRSFRILARGSNILEALYSILLTLGHA